MNYAELSKKYSAFHYDAYHYEIGLDTLQLTFNYRLESNTEEITFVHRISYYIKGNVSINFEQEYENFIFHIGLVETINYWKLACPKELIIHCGSITENQIKWWKKLYYHGLGEFIYLNNMVELVDEANFVSIICGQSDQNNKEFTILKPILLDTIGHLIPVGGGKDSVVSLEILRDYFEQNIPFVMSPPIAAYDCIQVAGYKGYLEAKRVFDKKLIELNNQGFLNGHIPFSAVLAFVSALGALLTKRRFIPLSNERSANEPSVIGTTFNHQYSKSYEFEKDFDTYLQTYLTPDIHYFSLLRPLYEIQIGELFAKYEDYHKVYRSCNRGKKGNSWCGVCAKCLFVYIILSPFVERTKLMEQFGKDLFEDFSLKSIFDELIGIAPTKPFECVGTIWEVRHALNLVVKKYRSDLPILLEYYRSINGPTLEDLPSIYEEGDLLTKKHWQLLKREMKKLE